MTSASWRTSKNETSPYSRPTGTLRDEEIRQELAQFGRAGVPLYLLYNPEEPNRPKILPELLSVDLVLDELSQVRETTNKKAGF